MNEILLIDDDSEALLSLSRALKAAGIQQGISGVSTPEKALGIIKELAPAVVVLDLSLNEREGVESGFSLLKKALAIDETVRVIVLTGHGGSSFGIRSLELGAAHFLEKPAEIPHLKVLIKDSLVQTQLRREYRDLKHNNVNAPQSGIVGESSSILNLRREIEFAAHSAQAIFLVGETGSGKGVCALQIHRLSKRKDQHFVRYQTCFSTADLVASELFGHVKGSFTGAIEDRRGLLTQADQGTLFIDEVDELPMETQISLLGVLQDKMFRVVGSNKQLISDFRLISASNSNIEEQITSGKFRRDLFHRIAHLTIRVPPLRDRLSDMNLLVSAFLGKLTSHADIQVFGVSDAALSALSSYDWPGNVRELESVIEGAAYRAAYHGRTEVIETDLLINGRKTTLNRSASFHDRVEEFKQKLISDALVQSGGNQVKASELLSLDRTSMRRMMGRK